MARKPRDFDAELQALMDKARKVKSQKTVQLGELVQVTGADTPPWRPLPARCSPPSSKARSHLRPSRGGPNADRPSFSKGASGGRKPNPATLLHNLQAATAQLDARTPAQLAAAWRHCGLRAFEADKEASAA